MNEIVAIMRAADFAARKHTKQKRKGEESEPYLNHLIEVASLVAESIDGRPDVIAALLHDAVEDHVTRRGWCRDAGGQSTWRQVGSRSRDRCRTATAQGRTVGATPTSNNYAPTLFAKEDSGQSRKELDAAMRRLFAANKIRIETYGRPSRPQGRLVRHEDTP